METIVSIVKGSALALAAIAVSYVLPDRLFYPYFAMLLTFAAGVYVGFAFVDTEHPLENRLEIFISLLFLLIAILGLWFLPILIAIGWALHGLWDLLHHLRQIKTETGKDYPLLCLAFDFIIAWFVYNHWVMTAP